MSSLSKEAALVHEALVARGLETPLRPPVQELDNDTRKSLIAGHMTEIMQLLNLDLSDDSLMETPHRIAKMYVDEIFSGLDYANFPKITVIENKMKVDEMVTVRDITLTSTCEHHFVTIDGKATVAYIPKDTVIGLSKINRIVQFFAQRPQVQERLTQQILTALQTLLGTNNVAVSIDAVHYCVKARGVRDATSATTTTSLGGLFKSSQNTRQEFLRAVRHHNYSDRAGTMERNVTLDFVRGVAILGILLLNISAFGLPKAAYLNPAWYGDITRSDAWTWAILDLFAQVKFLTLFALLFGAGLQLLLKRGTRWIQSRLTLLVILGFIHGLLFWDGDILLAYGLVGLICWRLIRDAPGVKSLFNTGVMLYVMGLAVLLLLGMIADASTSRSWIPDAANLQYEQFWKLKGGMEAIGNRADMLGDNLLALGAQYGWQLAGMMLMGAALMRTGWLKGEFSLRHYRRTGAGLVLLGVIINLPAVMMQWHLQWDYRWCAFLLQVPRELSAPFQTIGYAALIYGFWPQLSRLWIVSAVACVGRMALSNYILQTLICTTLFYRFGLFMKFDRLTLLAFVIPVWIVNVVFSVVWLRFFRQGPLEWAWRRLTARASGVSLRNTSR